MESLLWPLVLAAVSVGSLHSLAPDHWAPLAAIARARAWSLKRTSLMTVACGFGHVTVSAVLGILALMIGTGLVEALGRKLESFAAIILIVFGIIYAVWGARQAVGRRVHGHAHGKYDHVHDAVGMTELALVGLYSVDPCVALIPILVAAGSLGGKSVALIILAYEVACLSTMVGLVLLARSGVRRVSVTWLAGWENAAAGGSIALVGLIVGLLGI